MITVACLADSVIGLDIQAKHATQSRPTNSGAKQIAAALQAYFANPGYRFHLSLHLQGTPFQRRVWQALQAIPAGETRTYGDLAKQLHSGARAVGMACRANPIPVIVPCHRVVAANGLGGYAGKTAGRQLGIKRWLLQHEGVRFD
jgi:methylated-DNA-[protein]-cysteine S-methyltransferase